MSFSYSYSLAKDFLVANDVKVIRFVSDVKAKVLLADKLIKVTIDGDDVTVVFNVALDASEEAALKNIVQTHSLGDPIFASDAIVRDEKSSGTDGGTFTSGAWQTRDLNTISGPNVDLWITLSSNAFTLAEGNYVITGTSTSDNVGNNQTRIFNVTANTPEFYGVNSSAGLALIDGLVLVGSTPTTFRLEHQCQTTQSTTGFGVANGFGGPEIYSDLTVKKHF